MTNQFLAELQKQFPNMECAVIFTRDPKTKQLSMSPLFKLPDNPSEGFILQQAEKFQEYARGLSHMANQFHRTKFKKG